MLRMTYLCIDIAGYIFVTHEQRGYKHNYGHTPPLTGYKNVTRE